MLDDDSRVGHWSRHTLGQQWIARCDGVGETFSPDLHTGTGNFTVPIALPPGRNVFQPQLSLVYSTGSGNGPYGLGWSLTIPGVSRKDVELELCEDRLTIRAQRGDKRYRKEVTLPESFSQEKMRWECTNGILKIRLER